MAQIGDNRLSVLAGQVADLHEQVTTHTDAAATHKQAAAMKALEAGAALIEALDGWLVYGAALNEGRLEFNPEDDKGFGKWVSENLLSQVATVEISRDDRAAAMWAAANSGQFAEAKEATNARTVRGIYAKWNEIDAERKATEERARAEVERAKAEIERKLAEEARKEAEADRVAARMEKIWPDPGCGTLFSGRDFRGGFISVAWRPDSAPYAFLAGTVLAPPDATGVPATGHRFNCHRAMSAVGLAMFHSMEVGGIGIDTVFPFEGEQAANEHLRSFQSKMTEKGLAFVS